MPVPTRSRYFSTAQAMSWSSRRGGAEGDEGWIASITAAGYLDTYWARCAAHS